MARIRFELPHGNWEDWIGIALGVLIILTPLVAVEITLTPLVALESATSVVVFSTVLIGALVLALSAFEIGNLHRWEEVGMFFCGLALIALPFVFGYAGAGNLRIWHFLLGALVSLLASLETWQDWNLSDQDLAKHGH